MARDPKVHQSAGTGTADWHRSQTSVHQGLGTQDAARELKLP